MKKLSSGGGWPAILYAYRKAREVGGIRKLWDAMRSKNACKACGLGMGGQKGGMVNEAGSFPEVCKRSLQAMVSDMQGAIKPEFWSTYSIEQLKQFSSRELETCGRLVQPVLYQAGKQYYQPITWEESFRRISGRLKSLEPNQTFWHAGGCSSNEAGFLLQLLARVYGTNNVNNCSDYGHRASDVGLQTSLGSGTATIVLEDLEKADLVFIIGGNPASNQPRLMTTLMHIRNRGGEVIVINPVRETGMVKFRVPTSPRSLLFGTKIASLYVQPHIGGDLALLTGIAKRILEMGAHDLRFLRDFCEGAIDWMAKLRTTTWEEIEQKSGVSRDDINTIAARYAASKNTVFSWALGITNHAHGVKNVQAIVNLALMRGMVGRPNAGLMPIRGHSNEQGIGSMGVTPQLKDAVFTRLKRTFGIRLPTTQGLDTLACMEEAHAGRLKMGFCLGGNLYGSNPDIHFADQALANLETLVLMNTTLNTGHAHGLAKETIILPAFARDEEPQPTTQESMFNYIRLSDGGPPRHQGPHSEVEVISRVGDLVLGSEGSVDWRSLRSTGRLREIIAKVVPGFEEMANIEQTKKEFQVGGRTFHTPMFPTKSGLAAIHSHELPDLQGTAPQLRLMTVRSEGQLSTVVYEDYDIYRGQDRRDVILLHPDDIKSLGLTAEQRVTIRSETGQMNDILVRSYPDIRAGNALMYYPECNVLVSRRADPQSHTPAFNCVLITIENNSSN